MAVVYRCVGILTVDVVVFFRSPGIFHSHDSFPLMFRPRLWETSSGMVAVGVLAENCDLVHLDCILYIYYAAVQIIAESSDTPPIHCAQHVQQSVDMSIHLPTGLQCDPIQMAEVVQQEYVLVGGAQFYRRVNVANTVHLSKHHKYCLQCRKRVRKDRPPVCHLIADDPDK